ncbi:MAG: hypothetical protein UFK95_08360, partial [Ruminococcus champanellensis]|nr:hypothetical protein [Ruminococcus champanellensis]
ILAYCKEFLCDMTENSSADAAQSRQAGFVRYCLKGGGKGISNRIALRSSFHLVLFMQLKLPLL